jgi:Uma2 family endonuclease
VAMNEHATSPTNRLPTQAAEGLPRWRWTTAELERMARQGIFADDDQFELIGGEIVPMSPKGVQHEVLRNRLANFLTRHCTPDIEVAYEPQFNLAPDTYTHPDILLYPSALQVPNVGGEAVLLVIEVSDSSLPFDIGTKARLYAAHGVREYWVINARTRATIVLTSPTPRDGYQSQRDVSADAVLAPTLAPALTVRLDDLRLD